MASKFVTPVQPDLRPFIIYDVLPAGCVAHVVTEMSCPLLRQGETVVVDKADCDIATGNLFVLESGRSNPRGPSRALVEFRKQMFCIASPGEEPTDQECWMALFYSETIAFAGGQRVQPIRMADGPCKLLTPAYFTDRIIGRVVGILEASFVEPARKAA